MFLEASDFVRSLMLVRPAIGMVWWRTESELAQTMVSLIDAVRQADRDAELWMVHAEGLDSRSVRTHLMEKVQATDADCAWLFVAKIEEVLPTAADVLNGTREQLGRLRGVIVFVRDDRRAEFQRRCPDVMDWVGLRIFLASNHSPRFGLAEINESLRRLETQYGLTSDSYLADPTIVQSKSSHDACLWKELLTIRSELSTEEVNEQ
jgi:hypothetical protein